MRTDSREHVRPEAAGLAMDELLARSHALGSDPTVTNYGGGNTSCKAAVTDPVTGGPTEVLLVKGSGGDLGDLALTTGTLVPVDGGVPAAFPR